MDKDKTPADNNPSRIVSLALHPLVVGNPEDKRPTPQEVADVISALKDANICCFFVGEKALIYYGAGRVLHVCLTCTHHYHQVNGTNIPLTRTMYYASLMNSINKQSTYFCLILIFSNLASLFHSRSPTLLIINIPDSKRLAEPISGY